MGQHRRGMLLACWLRMLDCAVSSVSTNLDHQHNTMMNDYDDEEEGPPSHWGAEVKADGKAVPYVPPPLDAKLHLSQVELRVQYDWNLASIT